eukprot:4794393-Alexandrium_andersonii.AAC.1
MCCSPSPVPGSRRSHQSRSARRSSLTTSSARTLPSENSIVCLARTDCHGGASGPSVKKRCDSQ